jgi:hypothetical protein
MNSETLRREVPSIFALILVGAVLGGLLVGYEPVGGDPDRMYRPLKGELARALREGQLPFWSERFGLGVPLVAESHVAAFYPPNLVLYRFLDVATAYRLAMWVHHLALVGTTCFYARCLGLVPWGGALAALAFTLCGFQAIHSSHEPFYHLMPYLPLALGLAERYMATGRLAWLASLSLALGLQWTLGHFQIQTWTGGLVILTGLWRSAFDRRPWRRALGLMIVGAGSGAALAAVQLGLSWQFAELVGQTRRPAGERLFYSFPPLHWFELALPRPVRELRLGPEDPYWFGQQTTGFEAALYVGTVPLIFALVGGLARPVNRATLPWRILVPVSFAVATMPRWWPQGYLALLALPGLGYFRVPARYTLLTCLGLAVLAGEGFDRAVSTARFRLGLAAALLFGTAAAVAAASWAARADVHLYSRSGLVADGFLWAALAWSVALAAVLAWRRGWLGSWAPLTAAAVELGILYYAGTTQWGWSIALPRQSPVLSELARRAPAGLIGGELGNLPVRAGLTTGYPYLGFSLPQPGDLLGRLQEPLVQSDSAALAEGTAPGAEWLRRWLRRLRVTHLVGHRRSWLGLGTELGRRRDPALDRIVYHAAGAPATRAWSLVRLDEPFPEARVASRARKIADRRALVDRLARSDDLELAWFLAEDRVPERPEARAARLVAWDGSTARVEHDGPCDLVIARTFDPGWRARIDGGPEQPVLPVDGGFLAVRIEGSGVHRVAFRYRPPRLALWIALTLGAAILNLGLVVLSLRARGMPHRGASRGQGLS